MKKQAIPTVCQSDMSFVPFSAFYSHTSIEKDTIWGIDLKFQKHFIPATSGKIRIYLSENQIDLKRPVRILVNGQEKFNGRLRPSLKSMAESLSVFYDPERIFPVYVDITI